MFFFLLFMIPFAILLLNSCRSHFFGPFSYFFFRRAYEKCAKSLPMHVYILYRSQRRFNCFFFWFFLCFPSAYINRNAEMIKWRPVRLSLWMSVCVSVVHDFWFVWISICWGATSRILSTFIAFFSSHFFSASFALVCHSRHPKRRCLRFHYTLTQNKRQTVVKISHIPDLFDKSIDIECVWHRITWRDTVDWTSKRMENERRKEYPIHMKSRQKNIY